MLKFKCHYIMRWGTVESNATEAIHIIYVYDSTCIDNWILYVKGAIIGVSLCKKMCLESRNAIV